MENQPKRRRGGQPGNKNALKHGYYARYLNRDQQQEYLKAAGVDGLDEEIALIRVAVKNAATGGDTKNLKPLIRAITALDKLIRTRYRVAANNKERQLREAVARVRRDVLEPLGFVPLKTVPKPPVKSDLNERHTDAPPMPDDPEPMGTNHDKSYPV